MAEVASRVVLAVRKQQWPSRSFWREFGAISALSVLLSAVFTWPVLKNPRTTIPAELGDPVYFVWTLSWPWHAISSGEPSFWTTNTFGGQPDSLAYTDAVLGYLPFGMFGTGLSDAILRYNLVFVFAFALAFGGGYALARMLGSAVPGALIVGAAFAFAPWRLMQANHINVLSSGGMALSLGLLISGHGWSLNRGWELAKRRPSRVFWGWLLVAWQFSLGFAIGIPYAYVLASVGLLLALGWAYRRLPRPNRNLVIANAVGIALALGTVALLSRPYLRVVENFPQSQRSMADDAIFSPTWQSLFLAPQANHWWGNTALDVRENLSWANEQTVSPGVVLLLLAILGLVYSSWSRNRRILLGVGTLLVTLIAMGTGGPAQGRIFYEPLFRYAPGWDALRTSGRLSIWFTLGLSLLAAGYLTHLAESTGTWVARARRAWLPMLVAPAVLVGVEGYGTLPAVPLPRSPLDLTGLEQPILLLPNDPISDYLMMAWSVDGFPTIINGFSSFTPPEVAETRVIAEDFPSSASIADFTARGIKTVVVLDGPSGRPEIYKLSDFPAPR
ncbi:MAG: hypothetical protein ACRC0L_03065 [Angustibacter sp.]